MNNLFVITHDDCLLKNNGNGHPERKERLETIVNSIKEINDIKIEFKDASIAKLPIISLVHPENYIKNIFSQIPKEGNNLRKNHMLIHFYAR